MGPASAPIAQQRPVPPAYPTERPSAPAYPGGQYQPYPVQAPYNAALKSRTGLIVGLVLGGVVLAGVIALIVVVSVASSSLDPAGPWHPHKDVAGGYEIEFPVEPAVDSETIDTDLGRRTVKSAHCMAFFTYFEAAWFDLGSGPVSDYIYDYQEAAREVARDFEGRVVSRENRQFGSHTGLLVRPADSQNLLGSLLMLRAGNRVYLVSAMNYEADEQAAADRFINSFKLLGVESVTDPWVPYRTVGNTWTHRTTVKMTGMNELVSYLRYEVLSANTSSANVRVTHLDADKKQTHESELPIKFAEDRSHTPTPSPKTTREKVRVPAGEFDCDLINDGTNRTWMCRKTRLMVKFESAQVVTELVDYAVK